MGWAWVVPDVVRAVHDRQLAEHGGLAGTGDTVLVEPALASLHSPNASR